MSVYVGIDPGKHGGIAVCTREGVAVAHKIPPTLPELFELLSQVAVDDATVHVALENVHAGPRMGSGAADRFGRGIGALEAFLVALSLPYVKVTPQKWQPAVGVPLDKGAALGNTDRKNRTKARAQALFPALTVTHAIADALLIAEYARLAYLGLLPAPEKKKRA